MRTVGGWRVALWPAGLAFGIAAEWIGRPELLGLDAAAGFALLGLGLTAWKQRPRSGVGPIMAAAGFAWFLGTLWSPALYLHRGPLAQLLLSYPSGRLRSRVYQVAIGAAYVYAASSVLAGNDDVTIGFVATLVGLAWHRYSSAGGTERRSRLMALAGAVAFGFVLAIGSAARVATLGGGRAELVAYDLVVLLIAVGLFADLLWGRWTRASVAGLVVDLGEPASTGSVRDQLARTLGDPALVLAYRLADGSGYVDEFGRRVELPSPGGSRTVTPIDEGGSRVAVLVHETALLDDPALVSAVAAATRMAVSNARLQAEVRAHVGEIEASRRRIIEAEDGQRRRLELELREGAERRLARVEELVPDLDPELRDQVTAVRQELREFARGIHPANLTSRGLSAALGELAELSPIPVVLDVPVERFPPMVEIAAYFVCSEALANVAKHAEATRVRIGVQQVGAHLIVDVADDGVGGARPTGGSGLRGLGDRVAALGGTLGVDSQTGQGTRLHAELPLDRPSGPS